jgi:hypothetical protein
MLREATNKPYVKQFGIVDGVTTCINPIVGKYENDGTNRRNRRPDKHRIGSNKASQPMIINMFPVNDPEHGMKMIVSKFTKVPQVIKANIILKKVGHLFEMIKTPARVIWHYKRLN